MKPVPRGYIVPSAALTISSKLVAGYEPSDAQPRIGDVVYGRVVSLGITVSWRTRTVVSTG